MRVPAIREMAGLPERKPSMDSSPSFRDTINKYKKEFADRWDDEQRRAKTFEATQSRNSGGDSLRESFARTPVGGVMAKKAGAVKAYKRPIVVYEDQVSDVVRREQEFTSSRQSGPAFEPERKSRGKRASA